MKHIMSTDRILSGHLPGYLYCLSALSVFCMLIRPNAGMISGLLIWIILLIYCRKKQSSLSKTSLIFACAAAFLISGFFYYYWIGTGIIQTICSCLGLNQKIFLTVVTFILGSTALPVLAACISVLHVNLHENSQIILRDNRRLSVREIAVIFFTAVITVSLFSKSSPLYPFNNWVDTNIFLTVGKSLLHGKVLYVDIYEQKGPLLFFIFILPALISESSFIGVYFLEILSAFFFLLFSYKIAGLFAGKGILLFLPAFSFFIYTVTSFVYGGSVEELCLPFLTCSLYQLTGIFLQIKNSLSAKQAFINGVFIGCIFWIKYTMLGMYIGFIIVIFVLYLRQKRFSELFHTVLFIAAGAVCVTMPVLIYFIAHHAIKTLWTVYFYNNLFYYRVSSVSTLQSEFSGLASAFQKDRMLFLIVILGVLFLIKKHKKLSLAWFLCLGTTVAFCYMRWTSVYYTFILCAFTPIGYAALCNGFQRLQQLGWGRKVPTLSKLCGPLLMLLTCIVCFRYSGNTCLIGVPKSDLPQYKMAEIINASDDCTILNYGTLDIGLYTATGTVPNTRFFCQFNVNAPGMMEEQQQYIKDGTANFVVTRGQELEAENYVQVYFENYTFDGVEMSYYLYQRKAQL